MLYAQRFFINTWNHSWMMTMICAAKRMRGTANVGRHTSRHRKVIYCYNSQVRWWWSYGFLMKKKMNIHRINYENHLLYASRFCINRWNPNDIHGLSVNTYVQMTNVWCPIRIKYIFITQKCKQFRFVSSQRC